MKICVFDLDALLTRIKEEVRRLQRRHQLKLAPTSDLSDEDTSSNDCRSTTTTTTNSQHLLTIKQVNIICARILKEREEKIREEYDRILTSKLNGKERFYFSNRLLMFFLFQNNTKGSFDLLKINLHEDFRNYNFLVSPNDTHHFLTFFVFLDVS